MKYEVLAHDELVQVLELIQLLINIKDFNQFRKIACLFKDTIECDHIIFGLFENGANKEILNINYPQEWIDIYKKNSFDHLDPVVWAIMENSTPQHWADIYERFPPERKFLRLAHDFGLKDGCACHIERGIGQPGLAISASGNLKMNIRRVIFIFEMLAPHFYIALSSLRTDSKTKPLHPLTKRENEVLKWLSRGKTSWEISIILNVAEVTVNFHVKNIKAKLNVSGRSHAVAVAMHSGLTV